MRREGESGHDTGDTPTQSTLHGTTRRWQRARLSIIHPQEDGCGRDVLCGMSAPPWGAWDTMQGARGASQCRVPRGTTWA